MTFPVFVFLFLPSRQCSCQVFVFPGVFRDCWNADEVKNIWHQHFKPAECSISCTLGRFSLPSLSRPSCSQTFPYCPPNSSFLNMACNEWRPVGPRPRHNTCCVKSQENNTFPSQGADASKCQGQSVIMWRKLTLGFQSRPDKINRIPPPRLPRFV